MGLQDFVRYDPVSGKLYKTILFPRNKVECEVRRKNKDGYLRFCLFGKEYLAHKVCWKLFYGDWPDTEIDHKNGIGEDNRIVNLRKATRIQNNQNRNKKKNSTSKYKGVYKTKYKKTPWKAGYRLNKKYHHLGYFETELLASLAYQAAAKKAFKDFYRD